MLVDYTVIGDKSQSFLSETSWLYYSSGGYLRLPSLFNVRLIFKALKSLKLIVYKVLSPE